MTQVQDQFDFDDAPKHFSWYEAWAELITRPTTATFERLLADPEARAQRGYQWIFVVGAISNTVTTLFLGEQLGITPIVALLLMPLFGGTAALISFIATNWVIQRIAVAQGAPELYGQFHYAQALYSAPLTLATLPLGLLALAPELSTLVQGALLIVQGGLTGMALRAVNGFSWQQALTVVASALFAVFLALTFFSFLLIPVV